MFYYEDLIHFHGCLVQSMYKKLFANTMGEVPFKKRRFWYNSVAPSAQTSSQSPKEPNSFENLGEPGQLLRSTSPASQKSHSEIGVIHGSVAVTSAAGPSEVKNGEATCSCIEYISS